VAAAGVFGLADGQAVDVEPASGEQARDVGQDARLVLDDGADDVSYDGDLASWERSILPPACRGTSRKAA